MSAWVVLNHTFFLFVALALLAYSVVAKERGERFGIAGVGLLLYTIARLMFSFWMWLERMVSCA